MVATIEWGWHEAPREVLIASAVGAAVTVALAGLMYALHKARERIAQARHDFVARHVRHQTMLAEEAHHKALTGRVHPRVQERIDNGEPVTPELHR